MSALPPPVTATSHLTPPARGHDNAAFKVPETALKLLANRSKRLRIVPHSDDRVAGTPLDAWFDLGNLKGAFRLPDNLDAGVKVHFEAFVSAFALESLTPAIMIEVRGPQGWPHQSESFDSRTRGASDLLCAASGSLLSYLEPVPQRFALSTLPNGRVQVTVGSRDVNMQDALVRDIASVQWHLVIEVEPIFSLA
jgi:hypothetical protein